MPSCIIVRYARGCRTQHTFQIRQRVTITGREDHMQRAYDDACLLMEGMSALDKVFEEQDENWDGTPARYWLQTYFA